MSTDAAIDQPLYAHDSFRTPIGQRAMDDSRDCAYADFVRDRSHALLRSAFLLTGDQHLAEDLVQEALARTHRAWSRLERPSNAEAYARKVMYHAQVSIWRRPKVAESLPGEGLELHGGSTDDPAEATVRRVTLQRALLALSPKQRAVIVLRYYEDLSEAQIADVLGVTPGTVKSQSSKAMATLRRQLEPTDRSPAGGPR